MAIQTETKTLLRVRPRGFCAGVVRAVDIVELALEAYGVTVDPVEACERVDVCSAVAAPLRPRSASGRRHVFGHHEHHLVVLAHPTRPELAPEVRHVEVHAGQRSEYTRAS